MALSSFCILIKYFYFRLWLYIMCHCNNLLHLQCWRCWSCLTSTETAVSSLKPEALCGLVSRPSRPYLVPRTASLRWRCCTFLHKDVPVVLNWFWNKWISNSWAGSDFFPFSPARSSTWRTRDDLWMSTGLKNTGHHRHNDKLKPSQSRRGTTHLAMTSAGWWDLQETCEIKSLQSSTNMESDRGQVVAVLWAVLCRTSIILTDWKTLLSQIIQRGSTMSWSALFFSLFLLVLKWGRMGRKIWCHRQKKDLAPFKSKSKDSCWDVCFFFFSSDCWSNHTRTALRSRPFHTLSTTHTRRLFTPVHIHISSEFFRVPAAVQCHTTVGLIFLCERQHTAFWRRWKSATDAAYRA